MPSLWTISNHSFHVKVGKYNLISFWECFYFVAQALRLGPIATFAVMY